MRRALLGFYVYILGDPRMYITRKGGGEMVFDKDMFAHKRRVLGDGDGLVECMEHFSQSQMFEQFVEGRINMFRGGSKGEKKSDLVRVSESLFYNRQDFFMPEIRKAVGMQEGDRREDEGNKINDALLSKVMALTSNSTFKGDYHKTVGFVVQACREVNGALMSVVQRLWIRIKDSKGLRWKHASLSMAIMRMLLTDGPLTAIAEISDGIDKVRDLLRYNSGVGGQGKQVRKEAR